MKWKSWIVSVSEQVFKFFLLLLFFFDGVSVPLPEKSLKLSNMSVLFIVL